jgi:hypothetical protein
MVKLSQALGNSAQHPSQRQYSTVFTKPANLKLGPLRIRFEADDSPLSKPFMGHHSIYKARPGHALRVQHASFNFRPVIAGSLGECNPLAGRPCALVGQLDDGIDNLLLMAGEAG